MLREKRGRNRFRIRSSS